jgi:hypothetical protein
MQKTVNVWLAPSTSLLKCFKNTVAKATLFMEKPFSTEGI